MRELKRDCVGSLGKTPNEIPFPLHKYLSYNAKIRGHTVVSFSHWSNGMTIKTVRIPTIIYEWPVIQTFKCILTYSGRKMEEVRVPSSWRNQMELFSALLVICAGNSPVTGEFPHRGQWRRDFIFSLISWHTATITLCKIPSDYPWWKELANFPKRLLISHTLWPI